MFVAKPLSSRPAGIRLLAGLVLLCAFAGCKKNDADTTAPAGATSAAGQAAAPPAEAVSAQVAGMSADALRTAASSAQREQRLYAPAGNNAMEYYLALRDKAPNDAAVTSALSDLMPYALIATEQSISRDDFTESQRLYALMAKADPNAPALPRLKQAIADGQASLAQRTAAAATKTVDDAKRQADLEKQRLADQQKTQQATAQQLATQQAAAQAAAQQAAAQKAADDRAAAARAAAASSRPQPASPTPAPAQAAAQAPAAATTLRAISTPAPAYPPDAYRSATAGEVVVELTVGSDGSVTSVRVVRSTPPRVFDRAALAAVKRWRFQPVSAPITTRRTIGFNPGG
ncbi:energy transducer TonB [Cognatiluteimonas profundi]|uniref:energy transducer TonB n=1 Tax=Cognatiluteimonas profundi TaxID=2594501 RepID=UPI00131E9AF9|nr:energy transducer TonB [Lysobacter profundi]